MNFKINKEKNTILLIIQEPLIPDSVLQYAKKYDFFKKPEFHISIISFLNGKKILDKYGENSEIFEEILKLMEQYTWKYELVSEYYEIEKFYDNTELHKSGYVDIPEHVRKSIIQKVVIPDMSLFYDNISNLTGIVFEKPFSHITLYSWSDNFDTVNQGIGLYSAVDFEKYKKRPLN